MSVAGVIIKNGIAGILSKTVRIADQLLLVPFFLSAWGAGYYGEWLTLSVVPSVLAFSDFGLGTAVANSFVLAYSSGNKKRASNVYKSGLAVVSSSILFGIALSIVVMFIAKFSGVLNKSLIEPADAVWALVFMLTGKLLSFYNQLFEAMYRAKHRVATAINIRTMEGFFQIGVSILVLMSGHGVVVFALSSLLVSLVFNLVFAAIGIKILGPLPKGRIVGYEMKEFCIKGLGFVMTPIWQAVYFQGTTFVVRIILGSEMVAAFNTVRTVSRSINQLFSLVNLSIFPELQYAIGENNIILARKILIKAIQIVFLVCIIGVFALCTIGPYLYAWWTKSMLTVPDTIWYVFMVGIVFNALWWTAGVTFQASNDPYRYSIFGFISSVISVSLCLLLSETCGFLGASVGYVALDVIMVFLVFPIVMKKYNISTREMVFLGK